MKLDITRHNLGWTLFFSVFLLLFFWSGSISPVAVKQIQPPDQMPLGALLTRGLSAVPTLLRDIPLLLLILWNGLFITRIITRNMILEKSHMSIIIYLVVSCGSYFSGIQAGAFVVSLLLIWSFFMMIESFRRIVQYGKLFNSAILTGLAVLIYAPTVVYVALVPFGLIIFKKEWREWVVALAGVLLPFAICSYVYWGMGYGFTEVGMQLKRCLVDNIDRGGGFVDYMNPAMLTFWGIVTLITGWALVLFVKKSSTMHTRPYKSYLYFTWILLFSSLLFLSPGRSVADFPLIAIPLAVIIPNCFQRGGSIQNIAYLLLIGSAIFCTLSPLFF